MSRKKKALTLSVPPETKEQLEAIALRLGIKWGQSPSVSGLLVAIAQHRLDVGEAFTLNSTEVAALQQGIRLPMFNILLDRSHYLLLSRIESR